MMGPRNSSQPRAITRTAGVAGVRRRFQIEGFGETRPAEIALDSIACMCEGLRICEEEIQVIDDAIVRKHPLSGTHSVGTAAIPNPLDRNFSR